MGYMKERAICRMTRRRRVKLAAIRANQGLGAGAGFAWKHVDSALLADALDAAIQDGGAILFGVSRTGDALTVTLFEGKDKQTFYLTSQTEAEAFLSVMLA